MKEYSWASIIRIAKQKYGLRKVVWDHKMHMDYLGYCDSRNGVVYLNYWRLQKDPMERYRVLFHELGHIYCRKNGLWKNYHEMNISTDPLVRKLGYLTGVKAERYIDKWAGKEILKYFPSYNYISAYASKQNARDFRKEYLLRFKD